MSDNPRQFPTVFKNVRRALLRRFPYALFFVVDDDAMSREMMRSILETQGHEVHEASGGEEALVLLPRVKPHAVLLDILMPDCDGFEVLRRVKREELDYLPPVMVVTGVSDSDLFISLKSWSILST